MPHRMEIELTSNRDDDTFTWRAAGALKPRGTVNCSVLPPGSKVGDVVRVEAEVELEGITILSVVAPKEKEKPAGRIEVLGTQPPIAAVTTVLAGPSEKRRPSRFFSEGEERRPRRPSGERRPGGPGAPGGDRRPAAPTGDRQPGGQPRSGRRPTAAADGRDSAAQPRERGERERPPREAAGRRPGADGRDGARLVHQTPGRLEDLPARSARRPADGRSGKRRARAGLVPLLQGATSPDPAGNALRRAAAAPSASNREPPNRDALMDTLAPEHRPIVERLAAGGMPAVRKAVAEEQDRGRADGRPGLSGEAIVALAEGLLPDVKAALWLDRAEAAAAHLGELSLRDLRATVLTATARDERGRDLERQLREALEAKVAKLRSDWEQQLDQALTAGRILDALRLSARTPEPTARFPAALIERLAAQAGAAYDARAIPGGVVAPARRRRRVSGPPADQAGGHPR